MQRRGIIFILSSPSGAGKTTLTRRLLQDKTQDLTLSISATTRSRRSSEVEGVDYHFLDRHTYDRMKASGDFLETAEVHGHGYGTLRKPVEAALAEGRDMLFDIDWQGAEQMRRALGEDVVSIFILPPKLQELQARLERRAEDSSATIAQRLENARCEIAHWRHYDYLVVNDDLQKAYAQMVAILTAERARIRRAEAGWAQFVAELL